MLINTIFLRLGIKILEWDPGERWLWLREVRKKLEHSKRQSPSCSFHRTENNSDYSFLFPSLVPGQKTLIPTDPFEKRGLLIRILIMFCSLTGRDAITLCSRVVSPRFESKDEAIDDNGESSDRERLGASTELVLAVLSTDRNCIDRRNLRESLVFRSISESHEPTNAQ